MGTPRARARGHAEHRQRLLRGGGCAAETGQKPCCRLGRDQTCVRAGTRAHAGVSQRLRALHSIGGQAGDADGWLLAPQRHLAGIRMQSFDT